MEQLNYLRMDGKMRLKIVFFLFVISIVLTSCHKKEDELKLTLIQEQNAFLNEYLGGKFCRIMIRMEIAIEEAQPFFDAINPIYELEQNEELLPDDKLCESNFNKLISLTKNQTLFDSFDYSNLDSSVIHEGENSFEINQAIISNLFIRNKLKLIEYGVTQLANHHLPDLRVNSITHNTNGKELQIRVELKSNSKFQDTVALKNIVLNVVKQENVECHIQENMQIVHIRILTPTKGKHSFNATLRTIRERLPYELAIHYAFEI
jgi:hypothetical protein